MLEVNVKEARSKLSILLDRVERGEEIIIKPVSYTHLTLPTKEDECSAGWWGGE